MRENPFWKSTAALQNPHPLPQAAVLFWAITHVFCCLFFQMFQFLFLSAWAWLNPIDVNGKCVLTTKTGGANLPATNKYPLISHRIYDPRTHTGARARTRSSSIPGDVPPLKLETALQRAAHVVQK